MTNHKNIWKSLSEKIVWLCNVDLTIWIELIIHIVRSTLHNHTIFSDKLCDLSSFSHIFISSKCFPETGHKVLFLMHKPFPWHFFEPITIKQPQKNSKQWNRTAKWRFLILLKSNQVPWTLKSPWLLQEQPMICFTLRVISFNPAKKSIWDKYTPQTHFFNPIATSVWKQSFIARWRLQSRSQ